MGMRKLLFGGMLALTLTAAAIADLKKTFEANYAAISKAFVKKDLAALEKFLDPKFAAYEQDGTMTPRAKVVSDFKRQMAMLTDVSWVRTVKSIKTEGANTTVTVGGVFKGSSKGKDGKSHKFELNVVADDVWTKHGAAWQIKKTTVIKRSMKVDGKQMGATAG
jgi:hypothetical protein